MIPALLVGFLLVPIVEIAVIIEVGSVIGAWPTVILLLVESAIGAWIVRREGGRAWQALRASIGGGRMPSRELADAALLLIGGTLLLTPGFVTDIAGFFLVLPFTRPLARRLLFSVLARRVTVIGSAAQFGRATGMWNAPGGGRSPGRGTDGGAAGGSGSRWGSGSRVVPGEVVDDEGDLRDRR